MDKSFFLASASLTGAIIGAGVFAIPFVIAQAGVLTTLAYFLVLGLITLSLHLFLADIVIFAKSKHRLAGYAEKYLGKTGKIITTVATLLGSLGALLAYLILSGNFLSQITPLTTTQGSWIFYLLVFLLLSLAGRALEVFDVILTIIKIVLFVSIIFLVLGVYGFSFLSPNSLLLTSNFFNLKGLLIAYGSILFALCGYSIIPELKPDKKLKSSINVAQITVSIVYITFAIAISGFVQSEQFLIEQPLLHILFNLAGVFSVMTPYLMLSWVAYDLFDKDLGFSKKQALSLTLIIPIFLFLLGIQNFMSVISITGGIFFGLIAILILKMYSQKFANKNIWLIRTIQFVFALGAIAEIISMF